MPLLNGQYFCAHGLPSGKNVMLSKREANSQNIPSFASYIKADIPTHLDYNLFAHTSHEVTALIPGHFLSDT